jgi:hypothetical protein
MIQQVERNIMFGIDQDTTLYEVIFKGADLLSSNSPRNLAYFVLDSDNDELKLNVHASSKYFHKGKLESLEVTAEMKAQPDGIFAPGFVNNVLWKYGGGIMYLGLSKGLNFKLAPGNVGIGWDQVTLEARSDAEKLKLAELLSILEVPYVVSNGQVLVRSPDNTLLRPEDISTPIGKQVQAYFWAKKQGFDVDFWSGYDSQSIRLDDNYCDEEEPGKKLKLVVRKAEECGWWGIGGIKKDFVDMLEKILSHEISFGGRNWEVAGSGIKETPTVHY